MDFLDSGNDIEDWIKFLYFIGYLYLLYPLFLAKNMKSIPNYIAIPNCKLKFVDFMPFLICFSLGLWSEFFYFYGNISIFLNADLSGNLVVLSVMILPVSIFIRNVIVTSLLIS